MASGVAPCSFDTILVTTAELDAPQFPLFELAELSLCNRREDRSHAILAATPMIRVPPSVLWSKLTHLPLPKAVCAQETTIKSGLEIKLNN